MKKSFLAVLILTLAVGTVYSTVNWRGAASSHSASTAGSDPLELMPDSDFVMFIDAGQFFTTKLYSSITSDPKTAADYQKFETDALKYGVDIRQLKQIAVGVRAIPGTKEGNFYAIVTGSFDREKILAGIATNPEKVSMESENYGDRMLYIITSKEKAKQPASDSPIGQLPGNQKIDKLGMAFLNPGMVVVGNIDGVKSALDVQNGKHPNVLSNQKLAGYLSGINTSALIRFAAIAPNKAKLESNKKDDSSQKKKVLTNDELGGSSKSQSEPSSSASTEGDSSGMNMDKLFESVQGGYGSIDFATGFNLDSTMQIRSESEARQMSQSLNGLIGLGRMMLSGEGQQGSKDPQQAKFLELINQISVSDTGKDVKISMTVSEQLLKEIFAIIESQQKKPKAQ